jgi:predicted Fe-Mo cluster-binding NifX family protein
MGESMRIAVTSMDKSLETSVSKRFGRSTYIFVAETETHVVRIINNQAFASLGLGAGAKTAEMLAKLDVKWVATGEIGRESFQILRNSEILVVTRATGTCREILDRLEAGGLTPALCPTDPTGKKVPCTE